MTAVLENVTVNDEGFMTDPNEWTKEIAEAIAKQEGIEALTEDHWKIIEFCRQAGEESGKAPTLREITTGTGRPGSRLWVCALNALQNSMMFTPC